MSSEIPDPTLNFKQYQASLFKALVSAASASNALPIEDMGFYRTLDKEFSKGIDHVGSRLLSISNNLLQKCSDDTGISAKDYEDVDDVVDNFNGVVDVVDGLLERTDLCLDEMVGRVHKPESFLQQTAPEVTQVSQKSQNGKLEYKFLHAKNVVRPQIKFKDRINNSLTAPIERKIVYKPHAKVPLDNTETLEMDSGSIVYSLPHPYEYEIKHLEYPEHMFKEKKPEMYKPFDKTSATWVDTEEGLRKMMDTFEDVEELAVDLEYHNYRSYLGFTCLMQISTRDEDFIIDTLELRDKMWLLNEYFADPNIVKILHGADSDIIWLQRDFGLYIVNLFDTYFVTKVLEFPHHSLAYLLKKYCDFDADKKYQLADWRIRPVPEEMFDYARSDTHYLPYIYDCLRNELLEKSGANQNLLRQVLQRSAELSLHKDEKEIYDVKNGLGPGGWKNALDKWKYRMNDQQLSVFKQLHYWRDHIAREEDESVRYVLPNHMLFALVEKMPIDSAGVIGCCNPCPLLVRVNAQALALLIQRAKADALVGASQTEESEPVEKASAVVNTNSLQNPSHKSQESKQQNQPKIVKKKLDPSAFDLEKIAADRKVEASRLLKKTSSLFHSLLTESIEPTPEQNLADQIRATIKLTFPCEGLKVKVAPKTPAVPAVEIPADEHVFVPTTERETKRKDSDVVVLNSMSQKKKKQKRAQ